MSKKSKKRHGLAPAVDAPTQVAEEGIRLTELEATARRCIAACDWAGLLELGCTSLTAVRAEDRHEAAVVILRAQVRGLFPDYTGPVHLLAGENYKELAAALESLAACFDRFHTEPEFDLYVSTRRWTLSDTITVFKLLAQA